MIAHSFIKTLRDERGFTLIELLVAMIIGLVVSLAAFAILELTTNDVSLTTERTHLTQTGRTALEKIMLQLHSACVDGEANYYPIRAGSNGNELKFVSETSPLNSHEEPTSSLPTVHLHKIIFNESKEELTEKSWASSGTPPTYTFNESETPTERKLLKGVKKISTTPIFQYYRYYESSDKIPAEHTSIPYGELNTQEPLKTSQLEKTSEAQKVAKVTVSFALDPEGKESVFAKGYRPINLEDSAVFSLEPSSESASNPNFPCAET
jgi:prepilin-type N-terminal cleavage/methylation domain-containing protein